MNKIKYIVVKGNPDTMFIFNAWFSHDKFISRFGLKREDILSAGFVNLKTKNCYGISISLNLSSRKEDNNLLSLMYNEED